MDKENIVFEILGGLFKISNGNAESKQTYNTEDEAQVASDADIKAYAESEDVMQAEDKSPVDWKA